MCVSVSVCVCVCARMQVEDERRETGGPVLTGDAQDHM